MAGDDTPRMKYVLECAGLLVTVLAGVLGMYVTFKSSSPAPAPVVASVAPAAQATSTPASATQPAPRGPALQAVPAPASRPAVPSVEVAKVDLDRLEGFSELRKLQKQNTAQLQTLLEGFPHSVSTVSAKAAGYDPRQQACLVDVSMQIDKARYAELVTTMMPLLDLDSKLAERLAPATEGPQLPASASLSVTLLAERGGPVFDYSQTASSEAQALLASALRKRPRGEVVTPEVVTIVLPSASDYSPGCELPARAWRVTRETGMVMQSAFQQTQAAKISLSLQDAAAGELGRRTSPTATPFEGTRQAHRFVSPVAVLGNKFSLERQQLAPFKSAATAHRDDSEAHSVIGFLPGFVSVPQRVDQRSSKAALEFLSAVSYRLAVPMAEAEVDRVAQATAALIK